MKGRYLYCCKCGRTMMPRSDHQSPPHSPPMETKKLQLKPPTTATTLNPSDKLSTLPPKLLHHILSHLQIDDIIRLTTLSTHYKTLLSTHTHLNFDQTHLTKTLLHPLTFKDFIYQTLLSHTPSSPIAHFTLTLHVDTPLLPDISSWITFAVHHHTLNLSLEFLSGKLLHPLPLSLFTSKTLTTLSLNNLHIIIPALFKSFPSLHSLSLISISFYDDKHAIRLLSGCPKLEELTIIGCLFKNFNEVLGKCSGKNVRFLKILGLSRFHEIRVLFPRLEKVVYSGRPLRIGMDTLACLRNVEFNFTMPPPGEDGDLVEHRVSEILAGLCDVARLSLQGLCIEFLTKDQELFTRLPVSYCGLNHLKLELYPDKNQVQVVMLLLRRLPNLRGLCISIKTLTLTNMAKMRGHQDPEELSTEDTLKCLKKVEFKYFGGSKSELDLVQFLLENGNQMLEMNILYSKHKQTAKKSSNDVNEKILSLARAYPRVAISFS